jgi:hypothetical protein
VAICGWLRRRNAPKRSGFARSSDQRFQRRAVDHHQFVEPIDQRIGRRHLRVAMRHLVEQRLLALACAFDFRPQWANYLWTLSPNCLIDLSDRKPRGAINEPDPVVSPAFMPRPA